MFRMKLLILAEISFVKLLLKSKFS